MRKLALLVAAALVVSAPMLATSSTETFGAAKAKKKAEEARGGFFTAFSNQLGGKADATEGKKAKRSGTKK